MLRNSSTGPGGVAAADVEAAAAAAAAAQATANTALANAATADAKAVTADGKAVAAQTTANTANTTANTARTIAGQLPVYPEFSSVRVADAQVIRRLWPFGVVVAGFQTRASLVLLDAIDGDVTISFHINGNATTPASLTIAGPAAAGAKASVSFTAGHNISSADTEFRAAVTGGTNTLVARASLMLFEQY